MIVFKWFIFGYVFFSFICDEFIFEVGFLKCFFILVIDGFGNDDWFFYVVEMYFVVIFFNFFFWVFLFVEY